MTLSTYLKKRNTIFRGFAFVMLLHFLLTLLTMALWLTLIGLFQLCYVIPLALAARKRHEAGITVLVNGVCDALLFPNLK